MKDSQEFMMSAETLTRLANDSLTCCFKGLIGHGKISKEAVRDMTKTYAIEVWEGEGTAGGELSIALIEKEESVGEKAIPIPMEEKEEMSGFITLMSVDIKERFLEEMLTEGEISQEQSDRMNKYCIFAEFKGYEGAGGIDITVEKK